MPQKYIHFATRRVTRACLERLTRLADILPITFRLPPILKMRHDTVYLYYFHIHHHRLFLLYYYFSSILRCKHHQPDSKEERRVLCTNEEEDSDCFNPTQSVYSTLLCRFHIAHTHTVCKADNERTSKGRKE